MAADFRDNLLLKILGPGMSIFGRESDLAADRFDEAERVGIDQLLAVRVAQLCGEAPKKLKRSGRQRESRSSGSPVIPNQHPISRAAADHFHEDLRVFLTAYGETVPRESLLPMFESCLSLGLSNVFLGAVSMLTTWDQTGVLPHRNEQARWPLFVDCSSSADRKLRRLAEESFEGCMRAVQEIPSVLMCIRIVDYKVRHDRKFQKEELPEQCPYANEWLNLIGEIVQERHSMTDRILDALHENCEVLAERLEEEDSESLVVHTLRRDRSNAARRLAQAITLVMGDKLQTKHLTKALDSCLMVNDPNGLGRKRRVRLRSTGKGRKTGEMRSVVLSNTMLDFLVHRHLRKGGKRGGATLSLKSFLEILRDHYGLYVHQSPPGMSISAQELLRNKMILERRLRDLGLLVGVNDAESMKRLCARFEAGGNSDGAG